MFVVFLSGIRKRRKKIKIKREAGMSVKGQQVKRKKAKTKRKSERGNQKVTKMSKYA